jgi:hypothetical protein
VSWQNAKSGRTPLGHRLRPINEEKMQFAKSHTEDSARGLASFLVRFSTKSTFGTN